MGMFRDLKESLHSANLALDQAQALEARASGYTADPMQYSGGIAGTATIDSIADTGTFVGDSPVLELSMTVTVPGRPPYPVKHRQLVSHVSAARFQPGALLTVRVSPQDPNQLMIG